MAIRHGEGIYGNAVGVTTPLEHRLAQAGQVVKTGANTIRPGLFWDGNATVVSGTSSMAYSVRAFTAVTSRGASDGAVFLANDGTVTVTTTAAPGSNSRIDIIYVWQRDYAADGTNSDPVIGVVQGTAAASPTAPSLAAFPGAVELGRATVAAGATATNGAGVTISQTAPFTAMAGGTVVVRNAAELAAFAAADGTFSLQLDTGVRRTRLSGGWVADGEWVTWSATLAAATTNPTLGTGGSINARYAVYGKTVFWAVDIAFGTGATAGSGEYRLIPPVPFPSSWNVQHFGYGYYFNGAFQTFFAEGQSAGFMVFRAGSGTTNTWGSSYAPVAAGNAAAFSGMYQAS